MAHQFVDDDQRVILNEKVSIEYLQIMKDILKYIYKNSYKYAIEYLKISAQIVELAIKPSVKDVKPLLNKFNQLFQRITLRTTLKNNLIQPIILSRAQGIVLTSFWFKDPNSTYSSYSAHDQAITIVQERDFANMDDINRRYKHAVNQCLKQFDSGSINKINRSTLDTATILGLNEEIDQDDMSLLQQNTQAVARNFGIAQIMAFVITMRRIITCTTSSSSNDNESIENLVNCNHNENQTNADTSLAKFILGACNHIDEKNKKTSEYSVSLHTIATCILLGFLELNSSTFMKCYQFLNEFIFKNVKHRSRHIKQRVEQTMKGILMSALRDSQVISCAERYKNLICDQMAKYESNIVASWQSCNDDDVIEAVCMDAQLHMIDNLIVLINIS